MIDDIDVEDLSIRNSGIDRLVTVVRPGSPAPDAAVVVLLHGSNQTARSFRKFTGNAFDGWASEHGAVLAYLNGYRKNWNDARRESRFPSRARGIDDTNFVTATVDALTQRLALTRPRVFAVGYSAGGSMVLRLIHEIGARLSGAAVFSAAQPVPDNFMTFPEPPVPVRAMFFHGTADRLVPYDGGMASLWGLRPRGKGLSAWQTAEYYASRNGITAAPQTAEGDGVSVTQWHQQEREPVSLYTVPGGGHTIPGKKRAPRIMGRTSSAVSGAAEASSFLFT